MTKQIMIRFIDVGREKFNDVVSFSLSKDVELSADDIAALAYKEALKHLASGPASVNVVYYEDKNQGNIHAGFHHVGRFEVVTRDERNLILYFETCLVDAYGRAEGHHMNKEDIAIAKHLKALNLIQFGRLRMKAIQKLRGDPNGSIFTHYVRFSDKMWTFAHRLRRERSERMLKRHEKRLQKEMAQ